MDTLSSIPLSWRDLTPLGWLTIPPFLLRMLISHDRNYQTFDTKMQPLVAMKVPNLIQETPQKTDAGKNVENGT
jgi:hypothetical protein